MQRSTFHLLRRTRRKLPMSSHAVCAKRRRRRATTACSSAALRIQKLTA
ncbi:Bgt-3619 [Blumeria graminis f. sp. tritici]|uniref:Bgt-3619 n=1 Tax=Blumeria graminis f. sp. tritici TaxID=62690 RepID=A0A9X9QFR4_BLUGR|nr:Bgt-3619 [Blumeria graminis f. sp. tritici]